MTHDLSNEEKLELIRKGEYSIDDFMSDNEALARVILYRFMKGRYVRDDQWEELVNIARFGLFRATQSFDASRGNQFSTYAYWVIQTEIGNYFRSEIMLPNRRQRMMDDINDHDETLQEAQPDFDLSMINLEGIKITPRQREIYSLYLKTPSATQVAKQLGLSRQTVHESVKIVQKRMREKYDYLLDSY